MEFDAQAYRSREDVFRAFDSSEAGLAGAEAESRQLRHGKNEIVFHRTRSPLRLIAAEFVQPFPLLLLGASILSFIGNAMSGGTAGYGLIGAALLGVVLLNALVSFLQNYKAEKLMISFLDFIPKSVALLRDGRKVLLDAREVVPGDILFLQGGDKIPADGIVVEGAELLVDESILTGESIPLHKFAIGREGGSSCLVLSGATVIRGNARVLVVKTGRFTSLGAVSTLTRGVHPDLTPMQKELRSFVRKITWIALGCGTLLLGIGIALGHPLWAILVFVIGVIGANIPEGLLPTVTLALTQASARMGRQNAVVKQILSVETLGSTTVICTDKTGTLTLNKLHVEGFFLDFTEIGPGDAAAFRESPASATLLEIMALCNDAIAARGESGRTAFRGAPTEVALAEYVDGIAGFEKLRAGFERLGSHSFDYVTRFMSTTHRTAGGLLHMTVKGAPESVLERCRYVFAEGRAREMRPGERDRLLRQAERYASDGLRILALAFRFVEEHDEEAKELVLVGFVTMSDPPRPEVPAAVAACRDAGIRIIVLSGDKAETVAYLVRKLGIARNPRVIEGAELAAMDGARLAATLRDPDVAFARIAPEQKLGIVDALKRMGEVVAVTGDGVNDAPALKRADIGISMGLRGTDVAKEASDIILLDDNFATIIKAVEEGRAVYDNIRKFITYILASNVPELLPFIAWIFFPIPLPITVIQILSVDLFTDILPAIGLGNERPESDLMKRPPRGSRERLVTTGTFVRAYGVIGLAEAVLAFSAFFAVLLPAGWHPGDRLDASLPLYGQAAGAYFATIIFCQIGNVLACRTNRQSAIPYLARFNPWIAAGLAVEMLFVAAVVYVPALRPIFSTHPFGMTVWFAIFTAPIAIFLVEEFRKSMARSGIRALSP